MWYQALLTWERHFWLQARDFSPCPGGRLAFALGEAAQAGDISGGRLAAILDPARAESSWLPKAAALRAKTLLAVEINFVEIHSPEISYNYKAQGAECFYNTAVLM